MIGVVLCGGNSTRMGSDKGLLKEEEETWAELAGRKLKALQLPVLVSINPQQAATYELIFDKNQLVIDDERFEAKTPLFGILSVHLKHPNDDLFVLACDVKDMATELMQALIEHQKTESGEAYVYHTGDRPQPLCGIYTAAGFKKILRLFLAGELKRYSMMHALEVLNTVTLSVQEGDSPYFNNYNTREDM